MPTITVNKAELWRRLGRSYNHDEFFVLCFEYGIELDDDTEEEINERKARGEQVTEEPELKIEVPANRYDLLCIEGLSRALRQYIHTDVSDSSRPAPTIYRTSTPANPQVVHVLPSTSPLRPFFASAVLRMKESFTPASYQSFIDLQDKLHANLCRQRKLVAIGTHDLDTIEGPFRYECKDPKQIKFAPLNKQQEYTAEELMGIYESDRQLSKFLPIIRDAPAYPIIYDSKDRVLSMPPIINSDHSKITLNTRNIFIDVTATDHTKLDIVVKVLSAMFSEYCEIPFEIEPVKIIYPDGTTRMCPDMSPRPTTVSVSYINAALGIPLEPSTICDLFGRMSMHATPSPTDPNETLLVEVPPTRPDIFHECDLMEDVGIAYGFNKLPRSLPVTNTVAKPFGVNRLADVIRKECAMAGWVEVLPLILCSHDENFAWLNRKDPGKLAIRLTNPATAEYQVVRTTLLPGLLKTLRENRSLPLPLRAFEVSDVTVQDEREERRARNDRRLGAVYCDKKGGFEIVHGLLDRVMQVLDVPFIGGGEKMKTAEHGYYIQEAEDPTFFPGRAATIHYRPLPPTAEPVADVLHPPVTTEAEAPHASSDDSSSSPLNNIAQTLKSALPSAAAAAATVDKTESKDIQIGSLGILHPSVLEKFGIVNPCSALEIDVEAFL